MISSTHTNITKVSIITVNYNNSSGLDKTIGSVIKQSYTNYEFIVIDGKSSDNSVNIIQQYSSQINYWTSEKDNGIYDAMNKGIKAARGEYLFF